MELVQHIMQLPQSIRIVVIVLLAISGHFIVRGLKKFSRLILTRRIREEKGLELSFAHRYPKVATFSTLIVSTATFFIYFLAIGLILKEFKVSVTAYIASASVIGLAVGFGTQGLIQDVVIGLTLIFSDALNINDVVEVSGQIGKVESIGLRFTILITFNNQKIYLPNRNIGTISRYRDGSFRLFVDIQLHEIPDDQVITDSIQSITKGMYSQHKSIILTPPELIGVMKAEEGNWRYLRINFRLLPGQGSLIENNFRQRVITIMKKFTPDYQDWMVSVTTKIDS